MLARLIFAVVNSSARKGLAEPAREMASEVANPAAAGTVAAKERARRTGLRGETYAYWYLRSLGYVMVARNFTLPGIKGEIDLIGYDGPVLAFVEVKTRSAADARLPTPEDAVNWEKRRNLIRMARQFLRWRHIEKDPFRFDILALESCPGQPPRVRLHKGAFSPS